MSRWPSRTFVRALVMGAVGGAQFLDVLAWSDPGVPSFQTAAPPPPCPVDGAPPARTRREVGPSRRPRARVVRRRPWRGPFR